jgi:hypothetical protein
MILPSTLASLHFPLLLHEQKPPRAIYFLLLISPVLRHTESTDEPLERQGVEVQESLDGERDLSVLLGNDVQHLLNESHFINLLTQCVELGRQ